MKSSAKLRKEMGTGKQSGVKVRLVRVGVVNCFIHTVGNEKVRYLAHESYSFNLRRYVSGRMLM
jgi:hypothetical protein